MTLFEAKDDAPVGADRHAPEPDEIAAQGMEPKPRQVHVLRRLRLIEPRQNAFELRDLLRVEPASIAGLIETPQSPMPDAPDHTRICDVTIISCQCRKPEE